MHDALATAVRAFRLGMDGDGNDALVQFIDALSRALVQGTLRVPEAELLPLLALALQAQQRGDLLRVADLLEFEIGPRLQQPAPGLP
jgi:hypothetical protein